MHWLLTFCILFLFLFVSEGEKLGHGRTVRRKADDEPHLVSWKVLEGITEPFETSQQSIIPVWKQMKTSADQKAVNLAIQQALHEYGQILRHPYVFSEMPNEEKYDIFISMAKLLKMMGFYQRAELLLYEAMAHTNNPFEAHFQLGLLNLDKENVDYAKLHFKNCLFLADNDLLVLINLSVILLMENKLNESKYFITRILGQLENKLRKLSFVLSEEDIQRIKSLINYKDLTTWIEELIVKVLYGEFRVAPLATVELLSYFWNLYNWINIGEMNGRYLFDLGQSLYENGKPLIGQKMMQQGYGTADHVTEGIVSREVVKMRLAFDYPVVSESIPEIVIAYLNMTSFLSNSATNYTIVEIENLMDIYWPIPLLAWSALPIMPVIKELLWRFQHLPEDTHATPFVSGVSPSNSVGSSTTTSDWRMKKDYFLSITNHESVYAYYMQWKEQFQILHRMELETFHTNTIIPPAILNLEDPPSLSANTQVTARFTLHASSAPMTEDFSSSWLYDNTKIEIGIFGGHMNNHPIGQTILHRLLALLETSATGSKSNSNCQSSSKKWKSLLVWTLLSLPLVPDDITQQIARKVDRIVNLPIDNFSSAKEILQNITLDIIIFPDFAPFPDQQALLFQSLRLAPIQICLYIRGTSCITDTIDYYLLPRELEAFYERTVKASAINAIWNISLPGSSVAAGGVGGGYVPRRRIRKYLRPAWKEHFTEQVVLIDWPLISPYSIQSMMSLFEERTIKRDDKNSKSNNGNNSDYLESDFPFGSDRSRGGSGYSGRGTARINSTPTTPTATTTSTTTATYTSTNSGTSSMMLEDMFFTSYEHEGKIFFENQPVALLPIYPYHLHPLMDEVLFKIMRAVPTLQILLAIPDSFLSHLQQEKKYKLSWAKKLVRRLWTKGGNLFQRIRLLPSPLEDYRILQLLRQSDIVLDTFPSGNSLYLLSMAVSVGTPIITLKSGSRLCTPKEDYEEIRSILMYNQHATLQYKDHPLKHLLMNHPYPSSIPNGTQQRSVQGNILDEELPWVRSISNIAGFYLQSNNVNLSQHLIADNVTHYFTLATTLLLNREFAYDIRVQLLDAVDVHNVDAEKPQESLKHSPLLESNVEDDLYRFLYRIGMPWAHTRILQSDDYQNYLETQKLRKLQKHQKKLSNGRSGLTTKQNNPVKGPGTGKQTSDLQDLIRKTMTGTIYV